MSLEIEIVGANGTYSGQTVNLSTTGALVWISDERFAREPHDLVKFGERVAAEFHDLRIRFTSSGVVRDAEVMRVERNKMHENGPPVVACRFVHTLNPADCKRLGVNPAVLKVADEDWKPPDPQRPRPSTALKQKGGNGEAAEPRRPRHKERRAAQRVERVYTARLTGEGGSYAAQILNLSFAGALLTITDPAVPLPTDPEQFLLYTRRLGHQFSNGMSIRILDGDVAVQSDVVRLSERKQGDVTLVVIGVKFRRSMTAQECERLEIPAPRARTEPAVADPNPYEGKTRVRDLMARAMKAGATDLHIKVDSVPRMRMAGSLLNVGKQIVTNDEAHSMALELMTQEQAALFEREGDVELAYRIEETGRFRVSILRQRGATSLVVRCIPDRVPTIAEMGLHPLCQTLAERPRGLVLVTGPTGSGKSTTLAALIDHVNRTRAAHIITMEDPIEYLHRDQEAHITQREVGRDAASFTTALKRALRQDPDVIMIGEMRDLETIALALTAAETGHLVFATLHTTSAVLTPGRIIDVFPPSQQTQIRLQLADSLQGIMAQMLIPRVDHSGMVLAQEILVATEAVRALIRERKTPQIANMMQTGAKEGMQTLESALNQLVDRGLITYETAVAKAHFPKQVRPRGEQPNPPR